MLFSLARKKPKDWRPAVVIARKSFPLGHGLAVAVTCWVKDKRTWILFPFSDAEDWSKGQ